MWPSIISKAMARVRAVLARRPGAGIHADETANALAGMRARGSILAMRTARRSRLICPSNSVAAGNQVSPGWLLRAGLASCLATRIAMEAAATGISLTRLEVLANSTSDARGLLGMTSDGGEQITPAPCEVQLEVRMGAPNVARERLQAMVEVSFRCSPVSAAARESGAGQLCTSILIRADGRALGNTSGRAPLRCDIYPRPIQRALVLPIAARRFRGAAARARRRTGRDFPSHHGRGVLRGD